jgi:iron(III) transport system substrate-binding protein
MRLLAASALLALAAHAPAQTPASLEQAKREGEVVWYTSMNAADAEAMLKPFRERYPFLEISILRATSDRIRSSIVSEAADGRFYWDVVAFRVFDIAVLNRAGLLAAYRSPETRSGFPPGSFDPEGRWAAIFLREYVVGYNTRLVKPGEAPKSWQDLLAERWSGRIALDESDVEWYAAMLEYWGRKKGLAYMRALAGQKPQRRRGHQLLAQQLAAGEFALALVYKSDIDRERQAGAPLQYARTFDPTIASPTPVAISAKAPHPAAARLFVDFLLSKDGQLAMRSRSRVPVRTDLPGGSRSVHTHRIDPRLAEKRADFEAGFRRILDQGAR